jgi:predicted ATP-dependent Lon-type protease
MKKIITICSLLLIVTTSLFSKEKKREDFSGWEEGVYRSITITMDEDTLHIYSDKQYENLNIQLQGVDGTIVYTNRVNLQAGVEFMIPVSNLSEETSQVVLTVDSQTLDTIPIK